MRGASVWWVLALPGVAVAGAASHAAWLARASWLAGAAAFAVGCAAGLMVPRLLGERGVFFHTFAHEMSHLVAVLLTGGRPMQFMASGHAGGYVAHSSGPFQLIVTIAPYAVPGLAVLTASSLVLAGHAIPGPKAGVVLGLAAGYHMIVAFQDMRRNFWAGITGTDLGFYGPPLTLLWIGIFNLMLLPCLVVFAGGGTPALQEVWVRTSEVLRGVLHAGLHLVTSWIVA